MLKKIFALNVFFIGSTIFASASVSFTANSNASFSTSGNYHTVNGSSNGSAVSQTMMSFGNGVPTLFIAGGGTKTSSAPGLPWVPGSSGTSVVAATTGLGSGTLTSCSTSGFTFNGTKAFSPSTSHKIYIGKCCATTETPCNNPASSDWAISPVYVTANGASTSPPACGSVPLHGMYASLDAAGTVADRVNQCTF